jgi:hypothetical protein
MRAMVEHNWMPYWIYEHGKHIKGNIWELGGFQYNLVYKKEEHGESVTLVPYRLVDKIRYFIASIYVVLLRAFKKGGAL